jgi:hypothetical protein
LAQEMNHWVLIYARDATAGENFLSGRAAYFWVAGLTLRLPSPRLARELAASRPITAVARPHALRESCAPAPPELSAIVNENATSAPGGFQPFKIQLLQRFDVRPPPGGTLRP